MRTRLRASAFLLLASGVTPACHGDSPGDSSTSTTMTSPPSPSSAAGSDSAGSTTDGLSTGSGSGTDTEGANPREICQRYLACVAAVSPAGLPAAQMGFGENGSCWQGSEAEAQLCLDACRSSLEMYNKLFPEEAACSLCQSDSECDENIGEMCHLGKCTITTCSDGIVDPEEICDSQLNCTADCQGPQECNPLSGHGCLEHEVCHVSAMSQPGVLGAHCLMEGLDWPGLGQACGPDTGTGCHPGMGCAPKELDPYCADGVDDGCCQLFCDLGAPECEMGRKCIPHQDLLGYTIPPELAFLGVCVPS